MMLTNLLPVLPESDTAVSSRAQHFTLVGFAEKVADGETTQLSPSRTCVLTFEEACTDIFHSFFETKTRRKRREGPCGSTRDVVT